MFKPVRKALEIPDGLLNNRGLNPKYEACQDNGQEVFQVVFSGKPEGFKRKANMFSSGKACPDFFILNIGVSTFFSFNSKAKNRYSGRRVDRHQGFVIII